MVGLLILLLVAILLLVLFGLSMVRRLWAIRKVMSLSERAKVTELNTALNPYGFEYNEYQDIVQSSMYPWQREFGYCRLYDNMSHNLNMIFDCEPIYFNYKGKRWLLEIWKGQYGITTGAEIGLYNTEKGDTNIPGIFKGPFFACSTDEERIPMAFILERKGKELFRRKAVHWWLTGFSVGTFSNLKDLVMKVQLTFPNYEMRNAFLDGLEQAGYNLDDVLFHDLTIYFVFNKPRTRQPARMKLRVYFIQKQNRFNSWFYRIMTNNFKRTINRILLLKYMYPHLFALITFQFANEKSRKVFLKLRRKLQR